MPIRKKNKLHTSFVRTPEEKKLRKVEKELEEVKKQLADLAANSNTGTRRTRKTSEK